MTFLPNQSPACSNNAKNLIIVGLVFGAIWITGMILTGVSMSAITKSATNAYAGSSGQDILKSLNASDGAMYVVGMVMNSIGFLGLVIGMPILGSMRSKMQCDL